MRYWFHLWRPGGLPLGRRPRQSFGDGDAREVLALTKEYGISARLTFSNSLLREKHLADKQCNRLCTLFAQAGNVPNGVIVHSDLLLDYLKNNYPGLYFVSSTTKVLTDFQPTGSSEIEQAGAFRYVVPDFRLNKALRSAESPVDTEQKAESRIPVQRMLLVWLSGSGSSCYEAVSRQQLGEAWPVHHCQAPGAGSGYRFSVAMENPGFISIEDIQSIYVPMGFSHFKIEGRSLGSALILEFLLYYMTKPEYQLRVREAIYLDNTLDLF